ncbi:MAG TPA: GNAT family N-acetyltransferase [Flavobacteriales bacterium]|nr:GNAT family N-acetyltransferase [Flavobacteriales bacterium]
MLIADLSAPVELRTPRLLLRPFVLQDAEALFKLRSDEQVMAMIGRPRTTSLEDARALIERTWSDQAASNAVSWAVQLAGASEMCGTIGLYRPNWEHHRIEVGYLLRPELWGQGLMGEALHAVVDLAFARYGFHSVEAITDPRNTASRRLLEKNGFVLEGLFKENYHWNGSFLDSAVYSRLCPSARTTSH